MTVVAALGPSTLPSPLRAEGGSTSVHLGPQNLGGKLWNTEQLTFLQNLHNASVCAEPGPLSSTVSPAEAQGLAGSC